MSARSTGRAAVTETAPVATSTVIESTPSTAEISSVTARRQCSHVMPATENVVVPTKVRGVVLSIGISSGMGGGSVAVGPVGGRDRAPGNGGQGEHEQGGEDAGGHRERPAVAVDEAGGRGQAPGDGGEPRDAEGGADLVTG